jgi:hypothetical protein
VSAAKRQPRPGSPAFAALQRKWYRRAKASGFDDIESPGGDLRGAGGLFVHGVDLDALEAPPPDADLSALSAPYDHLAAAYWRYPWTHPTDRAICKLLSDGQAWAAIMARFHVGKARIRSVIKAVRDWSDPETYDA